MSITIENPTADVIWQVVQQMPQSEISRLKQLFDASPLATSGAIDESTTWSEEDLRDFSAAGAALYEKIEAEELKNASGG